MLKKVFIHTFQSFGIYIVYININNFILDDLFKFTTDPTLIPFFIILSFINIYLRKEESKHQSLY